MKIKFSLIITLILFSCAGHISDDRNGGTKINIESLSLEEKIGQMIMIRMDGKFHNNESWQRDNIEYLIKNDKIGGLITFSGSVHGTYNNIQSFQKISEIPLFIASDYERGLGIFMNGTLFPSNMALAATGDSSLAYLQGKITSIEAKSIGVNMILAPVLDINNNPNNPIINFRSYGDTPQTVTKYGLQFIKGIQDHGLIACAKHYPGHGNTATDSHTNLPVIDISQNELFNNELVPFKAACKNDVKSIMVGHIVIPSIDNTSNPSTFSEKITKNILRDSWNYDGLIITDALEMGALTSTTWHGESAIRAVEAGADIILLPLKAKSAIYSIVNAVKSGRISIERINLSYERIIREKNNLGLLNNSNIGRSWKDVENIVGLSSHKKISREIAEKSITLVKNDLNIIPFIPNHYNKVSHILLSTDNDLRTRLQSITKDINYIHGNVNTIYVNDSLTSLGIQDIINKVSKSDIIIVSMLIRISMDKGLSTIHLSHDNLLKELEKIGIPSIGISFGSPYLPSYDVFDAYLCTYGYGSISLNATTDALFGRKNIVGRLPITLNNEYKIGHGIRVKKNEIYFESKLNMEMKETFSIIQKAISDSIFPGAQLFVSHKENIITNKNFGKYTYSKDSKYISNESIYDVASLTKVLSTTPVVMKLIQKKLLGLEYHLSDFYEEFNYGIKKNITIRHLLTHSSGLPAYIEYFRLNDINSKDDIINNIVNQDLTYEPDSQMLYSDLGMILLCDIIEKVSSTTLDKLSAKYFYIPLDMKNTYFNPPASVKYQIVPTENDIHFRNKLLHGEVHDENAYILGGVSGHAGLFSNTSDIAKLSKLFLNEGTYLGRRYIKKNLVNIFTSKIKNPVNSDRALGWDTPSKKGKSTAGDYFSDQTYGHLGFTGTSLWIDPENDIIVIFLTNRVHPTRNKDGINSVRRELHTSIVKELLGE